MRLFIALFGLLAMVLAGLHAGPAAAHGSHHAPASIAAGHDHADLGDGSGDSDSSADLNPDQGHQHASPGPAPQLPGSDLERRFHRQIVFASEASQLHSGSPAPPLEPPIA